MRDGIRGGHWRKKEFVIDLSGLGRKQTQLMSPSEIEEMMNVPRQVIDASRGNRIGKMSMREFLEKYG